MTETVILKPATLADWPLIQRWLHEPAVEAWWGPAAQTEGAVLAALNSEHAIVRLVVHNSCAVGYAHALDATTWGEQLPDDLPPGTWDIDLFVADPAARGIGVGTRALELLRDEVFSTTACGCRLCVSLDLP